jgi:hypothetical protein
VSNKDEAAFPQRQIVPKPGLSGTGDPYYLATTGGLTKREYAAIHAPEREVLKLMELSLSMAALTGLSGNSLIKAHAELMRDARYLWADTMLNEKEPT